MNKIKFKGKNTSVTERLTSLRMGKLKQNRQISMILTRFGLQMVGLC